ncbi:MAG: acyl-CoA dehydrogenase family protein [Pseudomonadota bacterium]
MSDLSDPPRAPVATLATHEVSNQPPPLVDFSAYALDGALVEAVGHTAADGNALNAFGERVGSAQTLAWSVQANRHPPEFRPFDRYGHRLDEVDFHPAYHALMQLGLDAGIAAVAWNGTAGGHVRHAAMLYLMGHADCGVCCPFSMTHAAMPVLRLSPVLERDWAPKVLSAQYDPRFVAAADKRGVTIGMAMTEKQGGSDVRANTTVAKPAGADDAYTLRGHKWFCSAPMSDGFFTLAQAPGGLTCFFVPRWAPDGTRNALQIARLKDKLGDRSNASSEIEYHDAWALRVGDEGRGVATIIDMVQGTRLDCIAGSAGIMRAALTQALWHCRHRAAFGKTLLEQPLMAQVLADLCLEAEAATALTVRLADSFDRAADDAAEAAFARLATPIAKYWVCKRAPAAVYEAMECLGGAGYVEESQLPRLYRQAPLNSIWEGSGNVMVLDVLRVLGREPDALDAFVAVVERARGALPALDAAIDALADAFRREPGNGRALVERAALVLQAAVLVERAAPAIAEGFVRARLDRPVPATVGAGAAIAAAPLLFERAMPA